MRSSSFAFDNLAGRRLSGILETGAIGSRAYAVFAHCFTCDKSSLAAVRVARALAARGIGVLRFDFTGLGESEGQFGAGLSGDVQDVVCAARAMGAAGLPVQLLVGHSFGGAAVLAAAGKLEAVRAVAVMGTPFDAAHVLQHIGSEFGELPSGSSVPVTIGGRPFCLGAGFVKDIRHQNQRDRIADLGRALLVLHSPVDEVVSIDNASRIFQTARHPKSFISLDHADHLMRRSEDANYAAASIDAWSSRYIDVEPAAAAAPAKGVRVEETGAGKFQVEVTTRSARFLADEPTSVGGLGSGPSPYELLSAGLGACTAMTCRLYADRKGWPLVRTAVEVGHVGRMGVEPDRFLRQISFEGELDDDQRARLLEIADKCPVHRTLTAGATIGTESLTTPEANESICDRPEDHLRMMEETCAGLDATRLGSSS